MSLDDMRHAIECGQALQNSILTGPVEIELDPIDTLLTESLERCIMLAAALKAERIRHTRLARKAAGQ